MSLNFAQFRAFFESLWGYAPFPWQERLAERVAPNGWPEAVDLPTASGKTAAIDIALFHLALEADKGPDRKAPVRIAFVVDRRLVVDGAYDRARCIAEKLAQAKDGILRAVADRLRGLANDADPLRVVRLRGGAPMEPDWVRSPAQPTVVVSTVDQVGSRLLFRGYGVSDSMRPVHAGLLGSDALFLLDEAHLSQPFLETLGWVERYRSAPWAEAQVGPFAVVHLSATLPSTENEPFGLTDADRTHDALESRLAASKPVQLRPARSRLEDVKGLAGEFAAAARELSAKDELATVIAIVVNRVALARAIHDTLRQALKGDNGEPWADITLLIGRSRPLDRDRLLKDVLPRIAAGRRSDGHARALYVVATQCIEAGADLDFDALVTEIAPLDCLRQRFGRLDRLGTRHREGRESHAVILAAANEVGKKSVDPIYGDAVAKTWEWLLERGGRDKAVDFGIAHLELPAPANLRALLAPRASAPVMLPAYLDAFAQTWPAPGADPEVSLFLHGPDAGPADVQIVWRADLEEVDLRPGGRATEIVSACPPSAPEAIAVPLGAARVGLRREPISDGVVDLEGAPVTGPTDGDDGRLLLRWWGGDDPRTGPTRASQVKPGDMIVVPARYGGCDHFGWKPGSDEDVSDVAFDSTLLHCRRLTLRLHPALLRQELAREGRTEEPNRLWHRIADLLQQHQDEKQELLAALDRLEGLPSQWKDALEYLATKLERTAIDFPYSDPSKGAVLSLRGRLAEREVQRILRDLSVDAEPAEAATEDDTGSFSSARVELLRHCSEVEELARCFARDSGLSAEQVENVALAARLHDLGKAESRFQIYLHGGDELAWLSAAQPLAKSDERATREAAIRARIPRGPDGEHARHECWSVRLAESHPDLAGVHDPDLVLWLIGTHHGRGRPFFPPIVDEEAEGSVTVELTNGMRLDIPVDHSLTRIDSGWIERFERLKRRYGPWELARMEAILRLADHRASERAGSP